MWEAAHDSWKFLWCIPPVQSNLPKAGQTQVLNPTRDLVFIGLLRSRLKGDTLQDICNVLSLVSPIDKGVRAFWELLIFHR